ncbi:protein Mpv17-like isoform X2 [Coccinella septempunctata]|uniref:protein Mpv17-like isoform X2 n=1 Tax=Coccinella septempunctata TaxID=41139 RepID=UPI001D07954A|nr:protein Mpv17-like isoform X2 [Coccinella septempunctata]
MITRFLKIYNQILRKYPGPPKVYWLRTLSERVTGRNEIFVVIRKVIWDQLLFAPLGLVLFLVSLALVQGKMSSEIQRILSEDFPKILLTNYKVWPVIQLINFYLVPLHHQVLFIQTVAILWNTYMSWMTHSHGKYEGVGNDVDSEKQVET